MTITKKQFESVVRYSHNLDHLIEDLNTANHNIKSEINKPIGEQNIVLVNCSIYDAKSSLVDFDKKNKQ